MLVSLYHTKRCRKTDYASYFTLAADWLYYYRLLKLLFVLQDMDVDGVANVISFDVIVIGRAGQLGQACIHSFGLEIQCKTKSYHLCSSIFLLLKL